MKTLKMLVSSMVLLAVTAHAATATESQNAQKYNGERYQIDMLCCLADSPCSFEVAMHAIFKEYGKEQIDMRLGMSNPGESQQLVRNGWDMTCSRGKETYSCQVKTSEGEPVYCIEHHLQFMKTQSVQCRENL